MATGSGSHSQNSAFGNNSGYNSGADSMLYSGGGGGDGSGYGSTSGSVGSGLDTTAFAFTPSPPAPSHPHDRWRRTVGWFPWRKNNSSSTATTSASTWMGFGASEEQPGGSGGGGSRSSSLSRPAAKNTVSGNREGARGSSDKRESGGNFGESIFRWWRGVLGGRGGGSAVPSSGEASTLINPSLGSLSRLGGASQGEATYSLRGHGRGPGKAGVLIGGEEFERGAFETGETFLSAKTVPRRHRRGEEEEEGCGQARRAMDG